MSSWLPQAAWKCPEPSPPTCQLLSVREAACLWRGVTSETSQTRVQIHLPPAARGDFGKAGRFCVLVLGMNARLPGLNPGLDEAVCLSAWGCAQRQKEPDNEAGQEAQGGVHLPAPGRHTQSIPDSHTDVTLPTAREKEVPELPAVSSFMLHQLSFVVILLPVSPESLKLQFKLVFFCLLFRRDCEAPSLRVPRGA